MKRAFWFAMLLCVTGACLPGTVRAEVGHQPVFYEGQVGPYQARISVRLPGVIPGLAEITVRQRDGVITNALARPLKWNTGRKGAPSPDRARAVAGEPGLFAAELWFMEFGAHGVEVTLEGDRGSGTVMVPVDAKATRVLGLPKALGAVLSALGLTLVVVLVGVVGGAVRESVLAPGEIPSRRRRWAARGAVAVTCLGLGGLLLGGWRWWQAEAADYHNNRLYRPRPMEVTVASEVAAGARLEVALEEPDPRRRIPLVPDHGRMMHLFAVREPDLDVFAHLHPSRDRRNVFGAGLPPLPQGTYAMYAQITYETGFTETLVDRVTLGADLPEPRGKLDADDAWWRRGAVVPGRDPAPLGDGLVMDCNVDGAARVREPVTLRFRVRRGDGSAAALQPYLGMRGHLVVRDTAGAVFAHLHPSGSFSMASQQLLELRERGEAPMRVAFGAEDPLCRLPGVDEAAAGWMAQRPEEAGRVSFPYEFPAPGRYRLWVQVRVADVIRTGAFDLPVGGL